MCNGINTLLLLLPHQGGESTEPEERGEDEVVEGAGGQGGRKERRRGGLSGRESRGFLKRKSNVLRKEKRGAQPFPSACYEPAGGRERGEGGGGGGVHFYII